MKKIALFSLLCCLSCFCVVNVSYATCGASTIGFDGNQDPDDDEFLYKTKTQFDLTKAGYENSNHQNSGSGIGIECDTTNSAGCDSGKVIELLPGHVFKGNVVNAKRKYQCSSSFFGDDMWVVVGGICETQWGNLNVGQAWKNKTTIDCSGLDKTENNVDAVEIWEVICREGGLVVCKPTKCKEGYKLDSKNGKCIRDCKDCEKNCEEKYKGNQAAIDCCNAGQNWSIDSQKCVCKDGNKKWNPTKKRCEKESTPVDPVKKKKCKDTRKTVEGLACCDVSEKEATYDQKNDKCSCIDKDEEFKIIDGKGQCVAKEGPVVEGECEYYFTGQIQCANGNQYFEQAKIKLPKSEVGKECGTNILKEDVTRVMDLMKKLCKEKESDLVVLPPAGPDPYKVQQAQKTLAAFTASAKEEASVWKTAEGKFNTTRLASDITAGVVLGTVGGVVTGNIIKKNQVKKGFEALHCTVGGQKVADWGDEFSVGLRR